MKMRWESCLLGGLNLLYSKNGEGDAGGESGSDARE